MRAAYDNGEGQNGGAITDSCSLKHGKLMT